MNKKIVVYKQASYEDHPSNLLEFQDWLERQKKNIPEVYMCSACIDIEAIEGFLWLEIYYMRPETEEERLVSQTEQQRELEIVEERELSQLAKLKEKYEGQKG
jgi:hypothetical protein